MNNNDKIQELEAKLADLTARFESISTQQIDSTKQAESTGSESSLAVTTAAERVSSRRGMLKLAGAAAIGAVGATVVSALPAAADNGINLTSGTAPTTLNYSGTATPTNAFLFQAGPIPLASSTTAFPAALAGWSDLGSKQNTGVYGAAVGPNTIGVVGQADFATGIGVRGLSSGNIGVAGEGATGVQAKGVGVGLSASASNGFGIRSTAVNGDGLFSIGSGAGYMGVRAVGGDYAISANASTKANLFLQPNNNFFGETPKTVPSTRVDAHVIGEMENVNGDLWWCVVAGSPGVWRKISGPGAAGAFHPVTPGRVYDSRQSLPLPGALAAGQNRTVSVADRRDANLTTGAVLEANFVPQGATAVAANITVTTTSGAGYLVFNPGGNTTVGASTINWSGNNLDIANGVILALDGNRQLTVVAGGGGSTNFIVDITGFYL